MTEDHVTPTPLAEVAAEPAEVSVAHERDVVPDVPDTAGTVPADGAQ